jgi:hypothetical protein
MVYMVEIVIAKTKGSTSFQEVVQSARTMPNEADVTSSNPPPSLVWTYQKKKENGPDFFYFCT